MPEDNNPNKLNTNTLIETAIKKLNVELGKSDGLRLSEKQENKIRANLNPILKQMDGNISEKDLKAISKLGADLGQSLYDNRSFLTKGGVKASIPTKNIKKSGEALKTSLGLKQINNSRTR